ncbi:hypothetical protein GCM10027589_49690 [Actinocorallia lasiicapitis]
MNARDQRRLYRQQAWLAANQWLPKQPSDPDLRIGDTERTAATEALQQHYAEGRLDADELEERLDATLSAKTEGELRAVLRDLPGPHPWDTAAQLHKHHSRHPRPRGHHLPHRGAGFLKAPLLFFLVVILPVSFIFHIPWLIGVGFRVLLVLWIAGMVFGYVHRRRHR